MVGLVSSLLAAAPMLVSARHVPFGTRPHVARQAQTFGTCGAPTMIFAAGLEGRKETSFQPTDLTEFNHGSAQNPVIIGQFLCDTLVNACGLKRANAADAAPLAVCDKAFAALQANPAKTGATADTWNAAFGVTTNFNAVTPLGNNGEPVAGAAAAGGASAAATSTAASAATSTAASAATSTVAPAATSTVAPAATSNAAAPAATQPADDATVDPTNDPDAADCIPDDDAAATAPATGNGDAAAPATGAADAAGDFGSCSDPTILFTSDLPDRQGSGFIASNQADFNHGSALNIGVISDFICQRLGSPCKASQATIDACTAASAAAKTTGGGKDQTSADAFNAGLTGGATAAPAATPAGGDNSNAGDGDAAAGNANAGGTTGNNAVTTGGNVNAFTGSLGAAPVAISQTGGDRPFTVNGNTFVNKSAAAQRACDIQQNACSNAANSGNKALSVSACQTQQAACVAANA